MSRIQNRPCLRQVKWSRIRRRRGLSSAVAGIEMNKRDTRHKTSFPRTENKAKAFSAAALKLAKRYANTRIPERREKHAIT